MMLFCDFVRDKQFYYHYKNEKSLQNPEILRRRATTDLIINVLCVF